MSEHTPLTEAEREAYATGLADGLAQADDWRYCPQCGRHQDWRGEFAPGAPCMGCHRYPAARTSTATADTGLRERVEAELRSEDATAVLYGVTGTHPDSYGGVTKDEALEHACDLLRRLRAILDATAAPTTDTGARECDHPGIEHGSLSYVGICPDCHKCKFIGHGPLCVDCYDTGARDE